MHTRSPMPGTPGEPPFRRALGVFRDALRARQNLFHAITRAIAQGAGWRWAAVTRFKPGRPGIVEILGWWADGEFHQPRDYALRHTPCERVAEIGGYCYFDVAWARFPRDAFLRRYGVSEYAGQVYRDPETNRPLGHLVALHDGPTRSERDMRALFDMLTLAMGLELRHRDGEERTAEADRAALTDPRTGLGNRRAFDLALARHAHARPLGLQLAMLHVAPADEGGEDDLPRRLGAALAHAAGPHDELFRLGAAEFAWLGIGSEVRIRSLLERAMAGARGALAEHATQAAGASDRDRAELSFGLADVRRHGWEFGAAVAEAERRLVAMKRGRRAA